MKFFINLSFLFFLSINSFAQTASVRGFINDQESGEPVLFCNVIIEGKTIGASTDVNGFFNISDVPIGNHTLLVTYIGFDTLRTNITLKKNQILTTKLELKQSAVKINNVTISADRS